MSAEVREAGRALCPAAQGLPGGAVGAGPGGGGCNQRGGRNTVYRQAVLSQLTLVKEKIFLVPSVPSAAPVRAGAPAARQPDPVSGPRQLPRVILGSGPTPAPPPSRHFPSLTPSCTPSPARQLRPPRPARPLGDPLPTPQPRPLEPDFWGWRGGRQGEPGGLPAPASISFVGATPAHPQAPDPPPPRRPPCPGPIPPLFSPQGRPPLLRDRCWVAGRRASQAG